MEGRSRTYHSQKTWSEVKHSNLSQGPGAIRDPGLGASWEEQKVSEANLAVELNPSVARPPASIVGEVPAQPSCIMGRWIARSTSEGM